MLPDAEGTSVAQARAARLVALDVRAARDAVRTERKLRANRVRTLLATERKRRSSPELCDSPQIARRAPDSPELR